MVRGIYTSEFWLAVACTIAGAGLGLYGIGAAEIGAAFAPAMTYIGGRSIKKGMRGDA